MKLFAALTTSLALAYALQATPSGTPRMDHSEARNAQGSPNFWATGCNAYVGGEVGLRESIQVPSYDKLAQAWFQ